MPRGRPSKYKTEEERKAAHAIQRREWDKNNPEKRKEYSKHYREKNRERLNKYRNEYQKRRYNNDPEFRKRVIESAKRHINKNPERFKSYQRIYSRMHSGLRYSKSNLLRWITTTNTRIVELEMEIENRKQKIKGCNPCDRHRQYNTLHNLQESLSSITAKRDNYEQLYKENFVDKH